MTNGIDQFIICQKCKYYTIYAILICHKVWNKDAWDTELVYYCLHCAKEMLGP